MAVARAPSGYESPEPKKPRVRAVYYPSSDGKPMAETDKHRDEAINTIEALKYRYLHDANAYVSGNNLVFYQEGDAKKRISPDVYVVFGVPKRQRDSYMAWKEGGKLPDVAIEFTSKKTRKEDTHVKRPLYERVLGIGEYFLFDPTGDYLNPPLQGYRLEGGRYRAIPSVNGRLYSERLGLELVPQGQRLRLYDPHRGEWLLSPAEQAMRAEQEAMRAEQEAMRADRETEARREAEVEVNRLRAELEALRRQIERPAASD